MLRERLAVVTAKDGCAPQGQCGCCTVLVDGEPRVACVTPVERVANRKITTLAGLDPGVRGRLVDAFVATGASQCGFCTPGILVRLAALLARGRTGRIDIDRALAAHLCRCTGWQTMYEAVERVVGGDDGAGEGRRLDAAARRATLEGGAPQRVGREVPVGDAGFADDTAPRDAMVAVPLPPRADPQVIGALEAGGHWWVIGESLAQARFRAGTVQGRRTTVEERPPIDIPAVEAPRAAIRLATGWVEPAYLEPDASWCPPGGEPASPLANGGAFGGKRTSLAPIAARQLADRLGRTVRVAYSREDTVRLGPKRPPIAACAWLEDDTVRIRGRVARGAWPRDARWPTPYDVEVDADWEPVEVPGPPIGAARAAGLAEQAVLVDAALMAAGVDVATRVRDERAASVVLDTCALTDHGACAGARVDVDATRRAITRVEVRVAAGDPLDHVVLRSYCIGAAHMALGWVCSEGLAVDAVTGDVLDLTIRSFGVIRAARTPLIDVTVVDDAGPPRAAASDAVFAAVAAATWNALARLEGVHPEHWPTRSVLR